MSRSGAPVRLMVVGCGAVTERSFLPALATLGLTPAVMVDSRVARAESLAGRCGCGRVAADYREALGEVTAAIVALPHALHAPVAIDLLGRGIHVLVEKPMAVTAAECAAMNAAARSGAGVLAVGLVRRHLHASRWVKAAIDAGMLGAIESVDVREGAPYNWPVASDFFFSRERAGGGVLLDTGAHTLDQLLWWMGDVERADYRDDGQGGVEADCDLALQFASGARGEVELSRTRRLRNTAILRGSRGEIEVRLHANELRARPRRLLAFRAEGRSGETLPPQGFDALFVAELRDWFEAIGSGRRPAVDGEEGARAVALIERCYQQRRPLEPGWAAVPPSPRRRGGSSSPPLGTTLVTGAAGFIGGRLVERLVLGEGATVRALVHNLPGAARLARFPVALVAGSFDDAETVDRAVAGCDVVFHCAHDFTAVEPNLAAARTMAEACLRHGVGRLVVLSSFSVHEPLADGDVSETSPWQPCAQPYTLAKRGVEEILLGLARTAALPVAILEPTVVYGPFCKPWTLDPVRLLRTGRVVLPDGGEGLCNAVYVDDVVDAVLLAADSPAAIGERFLVSGPRPVTWRQFFGAFEAMLGVRGVVTLPAGEIERLLRLGEGEVDLHSASLDRRLVTRWRAGRLLADLVRHAIGERRWTGLKARVGAPLHLPSGARLDFYRARPRVRIERATERLGYRPTRGLAEGMALTAGFVRWAGL